MNPKLLKYAVVVGGFLALVTLALWQANKLVSMGKKLGEAESIERDLRSTLKEERDKHKEEIDGLTSSLATCNGHIDSLATVGERWRMEYERIKHQPPKKETIVLESTDCVDALVEAHFKLKERIEGRSHGQVPN